MKTDTNWGFQLRHAGWSTSTTGVRFTVAEIHGVDFEVSELPPQVTSLPITMRGQLVAGARHRTDFRRHT
jgi:hypothetical protein